MGGKAITEVDVIRLPLVEYSVFSESILSLMKNKYPSGEFRVIKSYGDKSDFGDLDVLFYFNDSKGYQYFYDTVGAILSAEDFVKNGDVLSLGVPVDNKRFFQVDFIKSSSETMDFSDFYFSYNDVGNLMGRIARFLGLKLGHNGLFYVMRPEENPDYVFENVLVTLDKDKAMDILGFDKEIYTPQQMKNIEGVFDFVIKSRYMDKNIFLSKNQNHVTRKREKKRKTYSLFIDYIEENNMINENLYDKRNEISDMVFNQIMSDTGFYNRLKNAESRYENTKIYNLKFNGKIVSSKTGITGQKLGEFIAGFKKNIVSFNDSFDGYQSSFHKYIIESDMEKIYYDINQYQIKFNNEEKNGV